MPEITPGNEDLTHHFVVFSCSHPESSRLDKYLNSEGIDCTDTANMPLDLVYCLKPYFVWGVGGQPFIAPPEAGFPLGSDEETTYFLLQSHYDNPELIENRLDSSGLRAYHTSKLRPNEAYTFSVGSVVDYGLVIPPRQPNFQIAGHCDTECFRKVKHFYISYFYIRVFSLHLNNFSVYAKGRIKSVRNTASRALFGYTFK